jgi:hypothetical protein
MLPILAQMCAYLYTELRGKTMTANVYTSISSQTLTSNAATLSLNSFSGYTDLRIVLSQVTTGQSNTNLVFNGVASDYAQFTWYGFGTTNGGGSNLWYTSGALGLVYLYGDRAQNGNTYPGTTIIDIPYYARTETNHMLAVETGIILGGASANSYARDVSTSQWANTSAITSIAINCGNGQSFAVGTVVSLYGITEQ